MIYKWDGKSDRRLNVSLPQKPKANTSEIREVFEFGFGGFVFCSAKFFVFLFQNFAGQQSTLLLPGLQSRLLVVVVEALGFDYHG